MRELKFRAWKSGGFEFFDLYRDRGEILDNWFSDEDIFEQFTGLKDRNGKEIYEGDIVRFDAISYEIYWSDDFSGWHNRRADGGERIYGADSFEEVTRFGSVIGNIHENPELIKEEK